MERGALGQQGCWLTFELGKKRRKPGLQECTLNSRDGDSLMSKQEVQKSTTIFTIKRQGAPWDNCRQKLRHQDGFADS
ncbi:hypothetical protein Y1Q_0009934 [Alligator mississippiensis]|uniref:Uncharacterized protein n=1 Tax=Alligator mississippiensis TaxID=8496 RepID=A0A151MXC0_ALLMI|nr:hypothetical protein Y1Q_0009934 [Alligator mississippiensis]